jgi:type II secretory pathway component PulF
VQTSAREFAEFNGLLGTVVEKGLPLPPALRLMAGVVRDDRFRAGLNDVARDLGEGTSLPDALAKHPDSFAPEYCELVRAGVDSNRLPEVLRTARIHHTLRARLRARLGRLVVYLLSGAILGELVLVVAVLLSGRMLAFNNEIMTQMEIKEKPEVTLFVESILESSWALLMIWPAAIAFVWSGYWISQRASWFPWIGDLIPAWGRIQKSRDLALFCCALGLRLRAGVPLVDALRSGRDAVTSRRFRRLVDQLIQRTGEGESLSSALYYIRYFPKTFAWGISLAEENGEVPRTIDTFTELYTGEMERSFELLVDLLTPLGMLAIGNLALLSAVLILTPFLSILRMLR